MLNTIGWDLGRFGIQFVASPRHADGLLITGPVTENMRVALEKTYAAVPSPKIVIAVGACAISGGPYIGHPEVHDGANRIVPVDAFVPGCPPHPLTILHALLAVVRRTSPILNAQRPCGGPNRRYFFSLGRSVLITSKRSASVPVASLAPSASPSTFWKLFVSKLSLSSLR